MGRYMRKSKTAGELTHAQSFSGVCTRAKTLALQSLRRSAAVESCGGDDGGSYLQLRSRRLQKPPIGFDSRRHNPSPGPNSKHNQSTRVRQRSSVNSRSVNKEEKLEENVSPEKCGVADENERNVNDIAGDAGVEASFGENLPESEARERTTRESTPSSTRPTSANEANTITHNLLQRNIPTTNEMDEYFARAEEEQLRKFIEKYNFDPVNEIPLPGHYEWEKVNP